MAWDSTLLTFQFMNAMRIFNFSSYLLPPFVHLLISFCVVVVMHKTGRAAAQQIIRYIRKMFMSSLIYEHKQFHCTEPYKHKQFRSNFDRNRIYIGLLFDLWTFWMKRNTKELPTLPQQVRVSEFSLLKQYYTLLFFHFFCVNNKKPFNRRTVLECSSVFTL